MEKVEKVAYQLGYLTGTVLVITGTFISLTALFTFLLLLANTLMPGNFLASVSAALGISATPLQAACWAGAVSAWPFTVHNVYAGVTLGLTHEVPEAADK